ncbi:MAG: RadC family protein [Syntrophales bacterium]
MSISPATPHHRHHRKRLKKKFSESGVSAFPDCEVLELLLSCAIPRRDVKPLAKDLLNELGSLKAIMDREKESFEKVEGIGLNAAILITLIKEMGILYLKEKAREKPQMTCMSELIDYCKTYMGGLKDERFCVIYLDAQNRLADIETIQEGIVNQAVVYPRKVLENALKQKASAVILAHNHASGYVKPSDADIRLTKSIQDTASILDIIVHDHVIIGENRFFSFREEGLI